MQSKTSFFNLTICRKNMIRFSPVWIVWTLLLIVMMPVRLLINFANFIPRNGYGSEEAILQAKAEQLTYQLAYGSFDILIFVFALAFVLCAFSYLHFQKASNAMHALPVTRKELFITNYFSGFLMLVVPEIVMFLVTIVISIDMKYSYMGLLGFWILKLLAESFLYYSIAVLTSMVTGVVFAVPFYYFIINFLVYGISYLVKQIINMLCYGLSASGMSDTLDVTAILWLTPFANFCNSVTIDYTYMNGTIVNPTTSGMHVIIIYAIAALVFVFISYALYKKRALENVGKLITVKWIDPIFRIGVSFSVSCLIVVIFGGNIYGSVSATKQYVFSIVMLLIVGLIVFFLTEMCLRKKLHVFTKKRCIEAACYLAATIALFTLVEVDAFGIEKKIPNIADVETISMYPCYQLVATTEEEKIDLMQFHSMLIADKKENEAYYNSNSEDYRTYSVSFIYYLKNGKKLMRNYDMPISAEYLADSESTASQMIAFSRNEKYLLRDYVCMNYDKAQYTDATIDLYNDELDTYSLILDADTAKKLMDAYILDAQEGNLDSTLWNTDEGEKDYMSSASFSYRIEDGIQNLYNYLDNYQGNMNSYSSYGRSYGSMMSYYIGDSDYINKTGYFSLNFNTSCTHMLQVLNELEIPDGYRLMTSKEYQERSEIIYNESLTAEPADTSDAIDEDFTLDSDMQVMP